MRQCDVFLEERGQRLGKRGFVPDAGCVERTPTGNIVLYHYSHPENVEEILADGSGLWARLNVVHCDVAPELVGYYMFEALLEPLPSWLTHCPYFGDFGLEMLNSYVGNVLLRIELPAMFPDLYVADNAHNFECKHFRKKGRTALDLGYDCRTGREVCKADMKSYIPWLQYTGGHVLPNVRILRHGEGIAVPRQYITINKEQPRS